MITQENIFLRHIWKHIKTELIQIPPLLDQLTKPMNLLILFLIITGCANNQKPSDLSGYYFSGSDLKTFNIYKIKSDEITKYSFIDSTAYLNYANVKENISIENDHLTLKVNNEKSSLTKLDFNKLNSLSELYNGYWVAKPEEGKVWKRYFKETSLSYEFIEEELYSDTPLFFNTYVVGPYFNEFYFIREHGVRGGFYLINNLSEENLKLFEISKNLANSISFSNRQDTLNLKGDWVLSNENDLKDSDGLFKSFTIGNNGYGELTSGAFMGKELRCFPKHDYTSVFLVIDDESLVANIIEFDIINTKPIVLENNKIIPYSKLVFVRE